MCMNVESDGIHRCFFYHSLQIRNTTYIKQNSIPGIISLPASGEYSAETGQPTYPYLPTKINLYLLYYQL